MERHDFWLHRPSRTAIALSPDGAHMVFAGLEREGALYPADPGATGGLPQLFQRRLDQLNATPIPGTEGGTSPFFSPDGAWIGFWVPETPDVMELTPQGQLNKVALDGGPPTPLCETSIPYGASWGPDDTIVFARQEGGIWRVAADGGTPEQITTLEDEQRDEAHRLPQLLPGGNELLFTVETREGWDHAQIVVQSLESDDRTVLVEGGTDARYVPTGHLAFVRNGTLMAAPFDLTRLQLTGEARSIVEGVMHAVGRHTGSALTTGAAQFTFSASGSLAYVPGDVYPDPKIGAAWVTRTGETQPQTPSGIHHRVSPDGMQLVYDVSPAPTEGHVGAEDFDVWVHDIARGTARPLTFDGLNATPAWSPSGDRIVFASDRDGPVVNLYVMPSDGSGPPERLATSEQDQAGPSWSASGAVAFVQGDPLRGPGSDQQRSSDIWVLDIDGDRASRPFLETRFSETHPAFSPDGAWLAYVSDESGQEQVYVRPYPGPGPSHIISTDGGYSPLWARNGRELFFRASEVPRVMRVDITTVPTFEAGRPTLLFEDPGKGARVTTPTRSYDVTPDGERFLMLMPGELPDPTPATEVVVVLNWFEELKRLAPTN